MAILPVVKYGDPILRKKVNKVNINQIPILDSLISDMFETMYDEEGIGLAANQVGKNMDLMVVDVSHIEEYMNLDPFVFINLEIIEEEGSIEIE